MERPNQMMPNGMNTMQRPQSGNSMQQIHAAIMNELKQRSGTLPPGWQSTFDLGQRANRIMQLVTTLRILQQDANKCLQIAQGFEERCILESPNKEVYNQKIQSKLVEIQAKRTQQAAQLPVAQMGGMPMNNAAGFGMPQNDMNGFNMMQNPGMGGMGGMGGMNGMNGMNMNPNINMNGMNMNNFMGGGTNMMNAGIPNQAGQSGQGFPAQLQRPMQASPLPLQHQQQSNTLDPSALQHAQGTVQPSNLNHANAQQQMAMGANAQASNYVPSPAEITEVARKMYHQTPDEKKTQIRNNYLNSFNPQAREAILGQGGDPLIKFFYGQARETLIKKRQMQMAQFNATGAAAQVSNNNNGTGAANMQLGMSQSGMQSFDLSTMLGQQANAIKAGEDGEQVVPASNNQNLPLGAQSNVNQGLNQQMLANQNSQPGNLQLEQVLALEREKQRQRQQQQHQQQQQQNQQNQIASNHAMAQQQAQQLRGVPGGLNTPNPPNAAQLNSPAFNMLNRPVGTANQGMSSTPQPARNQNTPTAPGSGASQVIQHHQNMINQNSQQQMGQGQALSQREQVMNSLPPSIREKLSELEPAQINDILAKWKTQTAGAMNSQQAAGLHQPNMNANGLAGNNQQSMMPGMPNGSAIPGFNAQPPPNQQAMQQGATMDPMTQQRLQQFQQQQALKSRALDMRPFPKQVLSALAISVPDTVTEWGKLKQHIINNQAVLPPNTLPRLQQAQMTYFEAHPEEVAAAIVALQQRLQQMAAMQRGQLPPGQPQSQPQAQAQQQQHQQQHQQQQQQQQQQHQQQQQQTLPQSQPMPNGQAPQAQMTQPNGGMQQPQPPQIPNAGAPNMNQNPFYRTPSLPTQQEVSEFRRKIPQSANMTDDRIRHYLMQRKDQFARQMASQQQQQALQAQQQVNMNMRDQMQRSQGMANGTQQGNASTQPNQAQQQPGQRTQQQQPPQQTANGQAPSQKRAPPGNDDVVEIANPNLATKGPAPPAPNMQANQYQGFPQGQLPSGQTRLPTQQDVLKMTPEQKAQATARLRQLEHLRRAQSTAQQAVQAPQGSNQQHPQAQQGPQAPPATNANLQNNSSLADRARDLQTWWRETVVSNPKGPAVQLDAASRQQLTASFKRWWTALANIDKTFGAALRMLGENEVKQAMRIRHIFMLNVADKDGTPKDYLSIGLKEWRPFNDFLLRYFTALKNVKGNTDPARQFQQQQQMQQPPQQQVQQQVPQQQQQPMQVNANTAEAFAKQNEQQRPQANAKPPQAPPLDRKLSQQSTRKASASSKVPAAPTEKKRFDWEIRNGLTADKLKLPAQKKRKTDQDSPDSRASASAGSPSLTQTVPEQLAKPAQAMPPKAPEPEKARFKCDDLSCDASITGFESEDKLKAHKEVEHGPVENAFDFLIEQAANALGLDNDGNEKKAPIKAATKAQPASGKVGTPTPGTKIGTPATPASGGRTAPKPASTVTGKDPAEGKAATRQEKTLLEAMAEKVGFEMPSAKDNVPSEVIVNDADELFLGGLQGAFHDSDLFSGDWVDLATVTDWGFPPLEPDSSPELTPSSRNSDVSQSEKLRINMAWDAFGNGDTGVPEILTLQELGLEDGLGGSKSEDTAMTDVGGDVTAAANSDADAQKEKGKNVPKPATIDDEWNWHDDLVDWDWGVTDGGDVSFSEAFR